MKNPLSALHALHEDSEDLFKQTDDINARNELAQSLTVVRDLICRLDSGEVVLFTEIEEVITYARTKMEAAIKILEPPAGRCQRNIRTT